MADEKGKGSVQSEEKWESVKRCERRGEEKEGDLRDSFFHSILNTLSSRAISGRFLFSNDHLLQFRSILFILY